MSKHLNFDLTNPTPFIKKYIQKNSHIINKTTNSLFKEDIHEPNHPFQSLPKLTQKLALELAYFRLTKNDSEYYLN
jgi:hypothetical protein